MVEATKNKWGGEGTSDYLKQFLPNYNEIKIFYPKIARIVIN